MARRKRKGLSASKKRAIQARRLKARLRKISARIEKDKILVDQLSTRLIVLDRNGG